MSWTLGDLGEKGDLGVLGDGGKRIGDLGVKLAMIYNVYSNKQGSSRSARARTKLRNNLLQHKLTNETLNSTSVRKL